MDAVTYPNGKVIQLLQSRLIALQLESSAGPYATDYSVKWTPDHLLEEVGNDYPFSSSAPEATFYRGVAGYKTTHQAEPLKQAYKKLQAGYHFNEWSRRAYPYWLLP